MLKAHAPLINQAANGLVCRLRRMHKAGAVQINNAMSGMTMEVIGGVAFGYAHFYMLTSGVMLPVAFACQCMQIFPCCSDPDKVTLRLLACTMHTEP